jgi:streptogramin lyase
MYAAGKLMFDEDGNLWSGQNWMPGSQSGTIRSIGGGVIKYNPDGTVLSPPITGFDGMGTDGIGWGTAVGLDKVWTTSFNGKILALDFDGKPAGKESDIPVAGQLGGLQGVGVANNGDIWIADATKNQIIYFPGGRLKDGRIVKVAGMKSPFGVVIDAQNRVWVSNAQSDTVVRFPADDPSKVETYTAGIAVRGIALDSKGNLWTASNFSLDFPPPQIPDGTSIMDQFKMAVEHLQKTLVDGKTTGVVNLILADGTQPEPKGFNGGSIINVPWGINIDGDDDVWVAGFWARNVVLMAGHDTKGHPAGTKAGDVIHVFENGGIQINTDVQIDPAGNVWSANNSNNVEAAIADDPPRATSTWGGGSGITVIYGVAPPVKTPLVGPVSKP